MYVLTCVKKKKRKKKKTETLFLCYFNSNLMAFRFWEYPITCQTYSMVQIFWYMHIKKRVVLLLKIKINIASILFIFKWILPLLCAVHIFFSIATICNLFAEKSVSSVSTHIRILQRYSSSGLGLCFIRHAGARPWFTQTQPASSDCCRINKLYTFEMLLYLTLFLQWEDFKSKPTHSILWQKL